jgi:hypothetical protein
MPSRSSSPGRSVAPNPRVTRAVDERHARVERRKEAERREHAEPRTADSRTRQRVERQGEDDRGGRDDGADVAADAERAAQAARPAAHGNAIADRRLEGAAPAGDQVVAGISFTPGPGGGREGRLRDLQLRALRAARELLDRVAVEVARGEVHPIEAARRAQRVVDQADALHQLRPVHVGDEPHAGDDVAHRHVGGALALVLVVHDLLHGLRLGREALLEPRERRRRLRIQVPQALRELHGEGLREGRFGVALQQRGNLLRRGRLRGEEPVGEGVGLLARGPARHDAPRRAPQVLHEHDAQRDRHRPQLADRQRLNALVGAHESAQQRGIEAAVGVRDEGPGHAEDARIAGEGPAGELRQLAVVAGRQIVADLADLLVDQVEVVDQPFGRRRHGPALADRGGEGAVRLEQGRLVVLQPCGERPAGDRLRGDGLSLRETLGVLLEALGAEELLADRLFAIPRYRLRAAPEDAENCRFQSGLSSAARARGEALGLRIAADAQGVGGGSKLMCSAL